MADTKLEATIELKDKISGQLDNVNQSLNKTNASFGNLTGSVVKANIATIAIVEAFKLGTKAISGLIGGLGSLAKQGLNSAVALEQNKMALETMIGSAEIAGQLLKDLSKFAARTPFNLTELQEYTKNLIAVGYGVEEIIPTLSNLGDIAAGVGRDKLPFLIKALSDVKTKGRLMGPEMMQFRNASIAVDRVIAKQLNISMEKFNEMMDDQLITYPMVERAMRSLTSEGGMFSNMMAKQVNTVGALQSNLEDFRDSALRTIGGINEAGEVIAGGLLDRVRVALQGLMGELGGRNGGILNNMLSALSSTLGSIVDVMARGIEFGAKFVTSFAEKLESSAVAPNVVKLKDAIKGLVDTLGLPTGTQLVDSLTSLAVNGIEKATGALQGFVSWSDRTIEAFNETDAEVIESANGWAWFAAKIGAATKIAGDNAQMFFEQLGQGIAGADTGLVGNLSTFQKWGLGIGELLKMSKLGWQDYGNQARMFFEAISGMNFKEMFRKQAYEIFQGIGLMMLNAVNGIVNGINGIIVKYNDLMFKIEKATGIKQGKVGLLNPMTAQTLAENIVPKGLMEATQKATGTMYSQGGLTLVGERGAELVNLPRGSKVTPSESVRGQGGTVNINIDVSGSMITNQEAFIEKLTGEISRAMSNQSRLNMYGIQ